jgi:hypothetical protein
MTRAQEIHGGRVYDEFPPDNHDRLAEYCLRAAELVRAVYYRMIFPERLEREVITSRHG